MINKENSNRILFLTYCIEFTAKAMNKTSDEMYEIMENHNLIDWVLDHFEFYYTQGIEYMIEEIVDMINKE